jgi:hypothetical protein
MEDSCQCWRFVGRRTRRSYLPSPLYSWICAAGVMENRLRSFICTHNVCVKCNTMESDCGVAEQVYLDNRMFPVCCKLRCTIMHVHLSSTILVRPRSQSCRFRSADQSTGQRTQYVFGKDIRNWLYCVLSFELPSESAVGLNQAGLKSHSPSHFKPSCGCSQQNLTHHSFVAFLFYDWSEQPVKYRAVYI